MRIGAIGLVQTDRSTNFNQPQELRPPRNSRLALALGLNIPGRIKNFWRKVFAPKFVNKLRLQTTMWNFCSLRKHMIQLLAFQVLELRGESVRPTWRPLCARTVPSEKSLSHRANSAKNNVRMVRARVCVRKKFAQVGSGQELQFWVARQPVSSHFRSRTGEKLYKSLAHYPLLTHSRLVL